MSHSSQQTLVDERFCSEAQQWSCIYDQTGLTADIYRLRRDHALAAVQHFGFPGARVLEVGCGAGATSVTLAKQGYPVVATDRLDVMVQLTRDRAKSAGVSGRVTTEKCDVYELPFPAGCFDVVLAVGVLPWLRCPERGLLEIARVLSCSGRVIITSDNKWMLTTLFDPLCSPLTKPVRRLARLALEQLQIVARSQKPLLHLYSCRRVDELLSEAGLETIFDTTLGFGPLLFLRHRVLPDALSVRLHGKLQRLADQGAPFVRSIGIEYLAIARKSIRDPQLLDQPAHATEGST
jgi:ubiquinone/menaquinone biosynthesis C-methylase UbiE